ncbi:MAG TPA: F0F1 ATP synthase subunit epsilon [Phycisphaerales bacterium]|jgi:F-type H+-transporting ATPase subunit epsilon|nr:F0F1 ATP synthase subunit epsilon [Phycisphaerales bacterium]
MRLRVLLPTRVLLDVKVEKVVAESTNGSFGLEPRHIDFVAALVPGVLSYVPAREGGGAAGEERFLATDAGVLVKAGHDVTVAVRDAAGGERGGGGADLARLREIVEERYRAVDARERKARAAVERIESQFLRWFAKLDVSQRR